MLTRGGPSATVGTDLHLIGMVGSPLGSGEFQGAVLLSGQAIRPSRSPRSLNWSSISTPPRPWA